MFREHSLDPYQSHLFKIQEIQVYHLSPGITSCRLSNRLPCSGTQAKSISETWGATWGELEAISNPTRLPNRFEHNCPICRFQRIRTKGTVRGSQAHTHFSPSQTANPRRTRPSTVFFRLVQTRNHGSNIVGWRTDWCRSSREFSRPTQVMASAKRDEQF